MSARVLHEAVYILHRRPYQESSFLLECFSEQHGRLTILAKGARRGKMHISALLQSFVPLRMSWSGTRELKIMHEVDYKKYAFFLRGSALFSGFYLNELILKLTDRFDPHPLLFAAYETVLEQLMIGEDERALRVFEKKCLQEIGYGLFSTADNFHPEKYYQFMFDEGFIASEVIQENAIGLFRGDHLLQFINEQWIDADALLAAKRLIRLVLARLLAGQTLNSRILYMDCFG